MDVRRARLHDEVDKVVKSRFNPTKEERSDATSDVIMSVDSPDKTRLKSTTNDDTTEENRVRRSTHLGLTVRTTESIDEPGKVHYSKALNC